MNISFWLNGVYRQEEIEPGMLLIDFLREKGCYSVKRGCETANCGLCTVLVEDRPILSCSTLAARIDGKKVVTMEGMQREAQEFGSFLANEGAEQCGFCNPGFIMNVFAGKYIHNKSRITEATLFCALICKKAPEFLCFSLHSFHCHYFFSINTSSQCGT